VKFGLLIQGPLLSSGRTGANGHKPLSDASVVHFDCRETILQNISNYGDSFNQIVVCTWDDGVFPEFSIAKGDLVRIPDNTKKISDKRVRRYWVNNDLSNNMLRQYYGIYQGLLKFNDIDYVIKIRTDQVLDLNQLIKSLDDTNRIYVAYFIRGSSDLPDFYFAARLSVLLDMFSILAQPDLISESPHQDIVLRYARARYMQEIGVDSAWYNQYPTSQRSKIFAYMLNNVFAALPRSIYESVIWRGEPFCEEYRQTFDEHCFDYPALHPQECLHAGIENALFRSRENMIARLTQKTLLFAFRLTAYVYNRTFK